MTLPWQINNIGTHTFGITSSNPTVPSEGGFEVPHQMEREYIYWIAKKLCKQASQPVIDLVDGYFCGGGTEGNIEGLWLGREALRAKGAQEMAILITPLTHYSVIKAAHLLDIRQHIVMVDINAQLEMDLASLRSTINRLIEQGLHHFIIVGTVGTTLCGSVDPIQGINQVIRESTDDTHFYFHVDASFGGYTVPFVTDDVLIGFENSEVQSIVVDGDKMGMLPYPGGVFLCRKNLQKLIQIDVPYIGSHMDATVSGSRSFVSVACGWYYIQQFGEKQHSEMVKECLRQRDRLASMLQGIPGLTLLPMSPYTNQLPVAMNLDLKHLNPLYNLRGDEIMYQGQLITVYKFCIFPHTFNHFETLVHDLQEALQASETPPHKKQQRWGEPHSH